MARKLSSEEYQAIGRNHYKQKQYAKAVGAFTTGIETHNLIAGNPVGLYDYRAAAHDKLGDHNAALKDGREAICMDKHDIRGYLRTANVLEKMGRLEAALGIYSYGMRNVSINNKDWKYLQQLHDKLTRQMAPDKSVDPFTVLPAELVEMVVAYLGFRNMVKCLRVSKGWKNYLTKRASLWTDLDFSDARKPVHRKFLRNAVNYSDYRITDVTVSHFKHLDVLVNIASACKFLTRLEFKDQYEMSSQTLVEVAQCALNLKTLVVRSKISGDTLSRVLKFQPTLETLICSQVLPSNRVISVEGPFPNLRSISLTSQLLHRQSLLLNLESLVMQSPQLRVLTLDTLSICDTPTPLDFSHLKLTTLHLRQVDFQSFLPLPPTLRSLVLQNIKVRQPAGEPQITPLPLLSELSVAGLEDWTYHLFSDILATSPTSNPPSSGPQPLTQLSLRDIFFADTPLFDTSTSTSQNPTGLLTLSSRILTPSLLFLDLATLAVTDSQIEQLLKHPVAGLTSLNLSSTRITGAGVKMLVDRLPRLKVLNVDFCSQISSADVVGYARRKDVSVSFRAERVNTAGKRVRYGM